MTARPRIGKVSLAFAVLSGAAVCVLGVVLVIGAESAFGTAWAAVSAATQEEERHEDISREPTLPATSGSPRRSRRRGVPSG